MRTKIKSFLKENKKKLINPEYYFSYDNNSNPEEAFDKAPLKVLITFPSTGSDRASSSTYMALYSIIKDRLGDDVFIDACYFPEGANFKTLTKNNLPIMFGNVSHAPAQDYDVMIISSAIIPEIVNIPHMLDKSDIPLTTEKRLKDPVTPLILHGGCVAHEQSILLGEIDYKGEKGHSLIDVGSYGMGEGVLEVLFEELLKFKNDKGSLKSYKYEFIEHMIANKILPDKLYYAYKYDWVYEGHTLKKIQCNDPRIPRIKVNQITENFKAYNTKIMNLDGDSVAHNDIIISSGCSGASGVCSFCLEGVTAGTYVERPLEDIEKDFKILKDNSAINTVSFHSYNVNYYSKFFELIAKASMDFSKVQLRNERLDVIANAPNQLKLARQFGLKTLGGAVEGISQRIRNGLFNKNLDKETLMKACEVIFSCRLTTMKMGLIVSGYETKEDIDEFRQTLVDIIKLRDELGSKTSLRLSVTPLMIYSNIGLRYLERTSAKNSYNGVRGAFDDILALGDELGIRVSYNGKGYNSYFEQLLMDFGALGTQFLCEYSLGLNAVTQRIFSKTSFENAITILDKLHIPHDFFFAERPKDFIFPGDHIEVVNDFIKDQWYKSFTDFKNGAGEAYEHQVCLKTLANTAPKCRGCGICTPKQIKDNLTREVHEDTNFENVISAVAQERLVDSVRIVIDKKPEYSITSSITLSHFITSQFLRRDDFLSSNFFSVGKLHYSHLTICSQKEWYSGKVAFDINFKTSIPMGYLDRFIEDINDELESCQIVKTVYSTKDLQVSKATTFTFAGYLPNTSYDDFLEGFKACDYNFAYPIRVFSGDLLVKYKDCHNLKDSLFFIPYKGGIAFYMALPTGMSPYLIMSSILKKSPQNMFANCNIVSLDAFRAVDLVCKCGENLQYSYLNDKVSKTCPKCQGKVFINLLYKGKIQPF